MRLGIIGLGIAGKALKDNAHLAGYNAVLIYDSKYEANTLITIETLDILCISAGIDLKHCSDQKIINFYNTAVKANIPIVNDIELFFRHFTPNTIAITGSYGKSTIATMIHKTLLDQKIQNSLRGNIGVPIWESPLETTCLVLEISNNQLELLESLHAQIGIITNIFPHHLTRYDNNIEQYVNIKTKLFNMSDIKICGNYSLTESIKDCDVIKINPCSLVHDTNAHMAGIAVVKFLNLNNVKHMTDIAKTIFLEHRFELFYENEHIKYINDSKSTDVEPIIQAVKSIELKTDEKLVLVCGGAYDPISMQNWKELIPFLHKVHEIILFGQAKDAIGSELQHIIHYKYNTFQEMCLNLYKHQDKKKKTIFLLSPGCQSFDEFKNFEERGQYFKNFILNNMKLS